MIVAPIMERELRAALRNKATQVRLWTAIVGVLMTVLHLCFGRRGGASREGQDLFQMLLLISSGGALFETVHFSIDLLSRERRNNTLGLLVLTGLSAGEIFLSKLTGVLVLRLCNGLALLPCFAVCFVLGGVPWSAFLATAAFIPNLTILTLSICLAASSISRDEDDALLVAAAIGGVIGLGGPAIYWVSTWIGRAPLDASWLLVSPVWGFKLIWEFFKTGTPGQFWFNSAVTASYSLCLTTFAAWFLQRTWREGVRSPAWFAALWPRAGVSATAARAARCWLEPNPFVWLALRNRRPVHMAWIAVSATAVIWLTGFAFWPRIWGTLFSAVLAALVMDGAVGLMAMFAAAQRLGEDRRGGALEILLTTPLSVEEIVRGQGQALWIAFRPLLRCVLGVHVALAVALLAVHDWPLVAVLVSLETWAVIGCLELISVRSHTLAQVMYASLNCARPLLAIRKVACPPGVLVAFGYFLFTMARSGWPMSFPQGSPGELWLLSSILAATLVLSAVAGRWDPSTTRLKREFRWIAQQTVPDPADPRLRRWDATKPFPQQGGPTVFVL